MLEYKIPHKQFLPYLEYWQKGYTCNASGIGHEFPSAKQKWGKISIPPFLVHAASSYMLLIRHRLFKLWIALSTGYIAIQWLSINKSVALSSG